MDTETTTTRTTTKTETQTSMPRAAAEPPAGGGPAAGRAGAEAGPAGPSHVGAAHATDPRLERMREVVALARAGRRDVLPELEAVFTANPGLWISMGDLTRMTEQAWIDKIYGTDLAAGQAARRHVEQMRKELAGRAASPAEVLLVNRVLVCWLAAQHADLAAAQAGEGEGARVAGLRLRQAESAHRRLLAAVKSLATVRRLSAGLKIEISHTHREHPAPLPSPPIRRPPPPPAAPCAPGGGSGDDVAEQTAVLAGRLRSMLSAATASV